MGGCQESLDIFPWLNPFLVISSHGVICLDKLIYHDLLIKASDWCHHATLLHNHIMSAPGLCFTSDVYIQPCTVAYPPSFSLLGFPLLPCHCSSSSTLLINYLLLNFLSLYLLFSLSCWCGLVPSSVALTEDWSYPNHSTPAVPLRFLPCAWLFWYSSTWGPL